MAGLAPHVCSLAMPSIKNITDKAVPESDIYQMLAYITALNLRGGMLIYAGEADTATYNIRYTDKTIDVASLGLSGTLEEILFNVRSLACKVKALRWRTMSATLALTTPERLL